MRGWTQTDVAGFIGTDGYTVNRWERGRARPRPYFRQKLCELFGKNAAELGLLSSPGERAEPELSSSPVKTSEPDGPSWAALWSVPHLPNPYFTGREELLHTLHARLTSSRLATHPQVAALFGLGGIGKTQVALEYAYRYAQHYQALFWIEAETAERILSSLVRVAEVLQFPEQSQVDLHRLVASIQHWLCSHHQWLLIWDGLEDLELLQRFLPSLKEGTLLITTRNQALGSLAQGVHLTPMTPEEGILFVLKRAKVLEAAATREHLAPFATQVPTEYAAIEALITTMGGLPLALDQAGAYLEETGCSPSDYLKHYEQQCRHILDRRGITLGHHPQSVTTTFLLASRHVERKQQAAADLLRICAFLHTEAIPEEVFVRGAAHLGPLLGHLETDPLHFDQMIAVLRSFSLVQRHPGTQTFSLHRLVQVILQEEMPEPERAVWRERTVAALNAVFPEVLSTTWKQCQRLLPHILAVAATFSDDTTNQELAELLQKAADHLRERAQYKQAETLYQQALRIWEQTLGPDTPKVTHALRGLALLAYEHGEYQQAEALGERALHIQEQVWGPEDEQVARTLNNLAILSSLQGNYEKAESLYQRALHIWEQALGPEHSKVAQVLSNLAELYLEQGKQEQAESLGKRALVLMQQALGPHHSLVVYPLLVLAHLCMERGEQEQAEGLFQQALLIWGQALEMAHPQMAEGLTGLAELYVQQGKLEQAEALLQRALSLQEQAWGREHPEIATSLNGLATLRLKQGDHEEAEALYQRALTLRERFLGICHPRTAQTLYDLAHFHQKQDHLSQARALAERALQIRLQSLGTMHPKTVATRVYYTHLLQERESTEQQVR